MSRTTYYYDFKRKLVSLGMFLVSHTSVHSGVCSEMMLQQERLAALVTGIRSLLDHS
jgi:hypothetical protein